ncbi:hypothetical protein [Acinetobacter sp. c1-l78]
MIEDKSGHYFVMEYNDILGISGFPEIVKTFIAKLLSDKIKSQNV